MKFIIIKGKFCIVDFLLIFYVEVWGVYVIFWVDLLKEYYWFIRYLKMKCMMILDFDIKCFVSVCGYSLERLEFEKCFGFSIMGL